MSLASVAGAAAHSAAPASRLRGKATPARPCNRGSSVKAMASAEPAPLVATSWRTSALAARHKALGSNLEDWNGMGTAWVYSDDPTIEKAHVAIRTKCGLMDVSGLKKLHVVGPHATAVLDSLVTRDCTKILPGKSQYACMLNERGMFVEDIVLFRMAPNSWMVVHGGGAGHELLVSAAVGRNCALLFDDDLHDLSLQGPNAVEVLAKAGVAGIRDLPYFGHMPAVLFGAPVMISRTGYTGERGYEIFVKAADAVTVWDGVLAAGKDFGCIPCGFTALDLLRVESYLLFYPFDMSETYPFEDGSPPGDSLWELGLTFTVTKGKKTFRGAEAHRRLEGKERFRIFGVDLGDTPAPGYGDLITDAAGTKVGVVTAPMRSSLTKKAMAIARLTLDTAVAGTKLTVHTAAGPVPSTAHPLPFDDPKKTKRTAKG